MPTEILIKTLYGLEDVLAAELQPIGVTHIEKGTRLVKCRANKEQLYRCNLELRTALRVLVPIASFKASHADHLYRHASNIPWSDFLNVNQTFAIDPNVHSDIYRHSHFASLRVKDALADYFNAKYNKRPSVNPKEPDVLFHLHIDDEQVTVSLDSSGESLNRRGYRQSGAHAPLNEVLAAGMLLLSGWGAETDLYDPMCGSGTLAMEAALIASRKAPGLLRSRFGFMHWSDFDESLWTTLRKDAYERCVAPAVTIYASELDADTYSIAKQNIQKAGLTADITLSRSDFFELVPQNSAGTVVLNPPYGERLADEDVNELYGRMGTRLKHFWNGHRAWILSANADALKHVGLKTFRKIKLYNGPLECRFQGYELFKGERKKNG